MTGKIKGKPGQETYWIDGVEVDKEAFDLAFPNKPLGDGPGGCNLGCWPMLSDALSVHPKQVEQANARNKKHGVNVEYRPDGKAVVPDRAARKRVLRLEKFHDNNGGYGD